MSKIIEKMLSIIQELSTNRENNQKQKFKLLKSFLIVLLLLLFIALPITLLVLGITWMMQGKVILGLVSFLIALWLKFGFLFTIYRDVAKK